MIGIMTKAQSAEATRAYLKAHKLMDKQHNVVRRNSFIYFPVIGIDEKERKELLKLGAVPAKMHFKRSTVHKDYRKLLMTKLGKENYDKATKSYDQIGDTAVVDADPATARKIAKVIMSVNKNVQRVVRKSGAVSGLYRTRKFKHVAGKRGYEILYRENGITLGTDIRKSFFSPRLAYERKRVSESAADQENVIVMFAGIGPFAILIAKEHPDSKVVAMELNGNAYKELLRNISLNRLGNVSAVLGDAKRQSGKYKGFADRIVMPLPTNAYQFLHAALRMAKRSCIIHYYAFSDADDPYSYQIGKLKAFFSARNAQIRILKRRIVRTYSSRQVEIGLDFRVSRHA